MRIHRLALVIPLGFLISLSGCGRKKSGPAAAPVADPSDVDATPPPASVGPAGMSCTTPRGGAWGIARDDAPFRGLFVRNMPGTTMSSLALSVTTNLASGCNGTDYTLSVTVYSDDYVTTVGSANGTEPGGSHTFTLFDSAPVTATFTFTPAIPVTPNLVFKFAVPTAQVARCGFAALAANLSASCTLNVATGASAPTVSQDGVVGVITAQ